MHTYTDYQLHPIAFNDMISIITKGDYHEKD